MATHINKNFSRTKLSQLDSLIDNGDVFEKCNFSQSVPHTAIAEGYSGLVFIDCNLMNCDIPEGSVCNGCKSWHKELCANLHPDLVALGEINSEDENCDHVVDMDEIYIDGELVDTIYYYADKKVT